jgi:hypothetical protein
MVEFVARRRSNPSFRLAHLSSQSSGTAMLAGWLVTVFLTFLVLALVSGCLVLTLAGPVIDRLAITD